MEPLTRLPPYPPDLSRCRLHRQAHPLGRGPEDDYLHRRLAQPARVRGAAPPVGRRAGIRETGKPIAQVARDPGINEGTLRNLDLPAAQVEVILHDYDLVLVPHVAVRLEQVRDDGTAPAPGSG